jgi:hypothetical protein
VVTVTGIEQGTQPGWAHNDRLGQWELHNRRGVVYAWVTDEMIGSTAAPQLLALHLYGRMGAVPPPLQHHVDAAAAEALRRQEARGFPW